MRSRQPRPKISFEPPPIVDPQPSETAEIVAAAIPLIAKEQAKAYAKAEASRVAEEQEAAAKAARDAEEGRAELERQLDERKGGLFSPTFTFDTPRPLQLPARWLLLRAPPAPIERSARC
eukprot:COSAG03_NODE_12635_length_538_cov_0.938497_1_plen_119_part_01